MRTIHSILGIGIVAFSVLACQTEPLNEPMPNQVQVTFNAGFAGQEDTKTLVHEDGTSIWWSPKDSISVFHGTASSSKFVATNTEPAVFTTFEGTLNLVTGSIETGSSQDIWAVYPYSPENAFDGGSVTLTVPAEQVAAAGTFAPGMFPAISKAARYDLAFYNVCGGIVFSVVNEGITSVELKGNNGENLAGKVKVAFDSAGYPTVKEVISGQKSITLSAPDGESFIPRQKYYITVLPGAMKKGCSFTFHKSYAENTLEKNESTAINRSLFKRVLEADKDLVLEDTLRIDVQSISLNKTKLYLEPNNSETLIATISPDNATNKKVSWSSSDTAVATVDDNGKVVALATGEAVITAKVGNTKASCLLYVQKMTYLANAVDLGIVITRPDGSKYKLYWADRNVGASQPEEYGNYYRWGETPNGIASGSSDKYRTEKETVLDLEDDAAHVYYGSNWRMPTAEEFKTLWDNSTVEWTDKNGVGGVEVKSKNNRNSIFLPAGGRGNDRLYVGASGFYWSSSLNLSYNLYATHWEVSSNGAIVGMGKHSIPQSVRGVLVEEIEPPLSLQYVDMGLSVKWASCNLGANKPEETGDYYAWGETEPKTTYTWGTYKWCNGSQNTLTKYCHSEKNGIIVDKKVVLEPEDDVARVIRGDGWRLPTEEECRELINNSIMKDEKLNGVYGVKITSTVKGYNNRWIFVPYSRNKGVIDEEFALFWSASRSVADESDYRASYVEGLSRLDTRTAQRCLGLQIRPIKE